MCIRNQDPKPESTRAFYVHCPRSETNTLERLEWTDVGFVKEGWSLTFTCLVVPSSQCRQGLNSSLAD